MKEAQPGCGTTFMSPYPIAAKLAFALLRAWVM
jgi:hypothetical protein